jgi:hypothetical protein
MIEILIGKIQQPFLAQFLPALLLGVQQKKLVDESGMTRTQMGSTIDQKVAAVAWDTLCGTIL